jgi:hypothetical protein
MDFPDSLTDFDDHLAELEWRWDWIFDQFWSIYDLLNDIKDALDYNEFPDPTEFDPLLTIVDY